MLKRVIKAPFYFNLFFEDLLYIKRTGKVDDLLVYWSKPFAWRKWTPFLSQPCMCMSCTSNWITRALIHQNELHATPLGQRYQGHSRFSKNYPPCTSLTAISCLYTIIVMFLKGMFINISSCRMPTRSFGRKELSPYSDFVTTVPCVPSAQKFSKMQNNNWQLVSFGMQRSINPKMFLKNALFARFKICIESYLQTKE